MNRFHKTLGVLHIVELAPWLWFAEGALQLKPTCLLLLTRRQQSADREDKVCLSLDFWSGWTNFTVEILVRRTKITGKIGPPTEKMVRPWRSRHSAVMRVVSALRQFYDE